VAAEGEVRAVLRQAVTEDARAVPATCSTLGGVAEAGTADAGVPVLCVDRPMAAAVVGLGPRVVVLATLESTLGPTYGLVEDEAVRAGRPVAVRTYLLDDAWRAFEAGDTERCVRPVADAADRIGGADAMVLAQASMAPAGWSPPPFRCSPVRAEGSRPGKGGAAAVARLSPRASCPRVTGRDAVG
jgi:hypothetical protein